MLGCILLDPPHCLGECVEKCKNGSEVFYDLRHQVIYDTLVDMQNEGEAIDVTISVGVAELEQGMDMKGFYKSADDKLYEAKRTGRNKVCS